MRTLKFRGWSIDDEKWCSRVDYDGYKERWTGIVEVNSPIEKDKYIGEYAADPEKIIIEPSTGLKDKNGKEIYVGDIVKQTYSNLVYPVRLEYGGFLPFTSDIMSFDNDYCEVIGNVHENPELLGGATK